MQFWLEHLTPYKGWVVLSLTFGILTITASLGLSATAAYLLAKAAQHPATILLLWIPIVSVRIFGTARGVLRYGDRYFSHDVTFRLLKNLRVRLYAVLELMSPLITRSYISGDLLTRFSADVETLQNAYLGLLSPTVAALGGTLVAAGIGWVIAPPIGLILLGSLSVAGVMLAWPVHRLTARSGRELIRWRALLASHWVDWIYGRADILTLNYDTVVLRRHQDLQQQWRRISRRMNRLRGWAVAANEGLNHLIVWLVLVAASWLAVHHRLPGLDVSVAALLAMASFEAIRPLPGAFQMSAEIVEATFRIQQLTEHQREPRPLAPWHPDDHPPRIDLVSLSFRYAPGDPWVFDGANLTLVPGEPCVVIGESGSGKSSLIELLVGFLRPVAGELLYQGHPWANIPDEALHQQLGVMNQHPHLFDTTLRQNLLLGRPDADADTLWSVLDQVQLGEWARALPEGLDTPVGEHGQILSGGQKKRLALARVLLKDAPVLLLDEPTEGLDLPLARRIMTTVLHQATGKTVLWICHDRSYHGLVDRVVEIVDGGFRELRSQHLDERQESR